MAKKMQEKFLTVILTLAMAASLMPAVTPPAKALDPVALPIYVGGTAISNFSGLVADSNGTTLLSKTGTTTVSADNYLQLTDSSGSQAGTVVRRSPIQLDGGFSTYFVATMSGFGSEAGDGLCFIMYDSSEGVQSGGTGINLGYSDYDNAGHIIEGNSLAVELDTYCNYGEELNGSGIHTTAYPHVAVNTNDWDGSRPGSTNDPRYSASNSTGANILHSGYDSSTSTSYSSPTDDGTGRIAHGFNLTSGADIHIWIDYFGKSDGATSEVVVTYGPSSTRADSTNHTFKRQLSNRNLLSGSVYVGFSASTGGAYEKHVIKEWYFSNTAIESGIDPTSGNYVQAVSTVSVSPGSDTNPSTVTVMLYDASGAAMSGTADIYVDGNLKATGVSVDADGYVYSIPSGLSDASHKVKAVAPGGAAGEADFLISSPVGISLGSATLADDGKYYYTDAEVTGDGIRTILISFSDNVTAGDAITLPAATPTGFGVSGNNYTRRINVAEGTAAVDIQDYLSGVGFSLASGTQTVSVTVTSEEITTDTFYNIDTEHYYQYIPAGPSGITWTAAYNTAKGMTYMGRTGYLATVTSKDEDTYLNSLSDGSVGWLGGTILTNSGTRINAAGDTVVDGLYYSFFTTTSVVSGSNKGWYWACGPEIGDIFYNTNSVQGLTASEISATDAENAELDYYFNWGRGEEPNNQTATQTSGHNDYETCLTTLVVGSRGKQNTLFSWNDIRFDKITQSDTYSARGYFVEYGDKLKGDYGSGSAAYASDSGLLNNVYTITYNLNDGTNPSDAPTVYTYGTGATLPTPTRNGFTFGGWYTDSGCTDSAVTAISTTDTGAKEYWAKWTENTYAVTVNVRLNGSPADAPITGAVELRQSGSTVYTMTGSSGVYTVSAVNGTYDIYINGTDTGTDVVISDLAGSACIDYYTVAFTASHDGTASGSSISFATYGGSSLSSGSIVLGGKTLVITAVGGGADYYGYLWSGTGVGGENASTFTVTALNRMVDALCTVTGRTSAAAYSVLLNTYGGAISSGSVTSYTYGVGVALPTDVTKAGYTFAGWYETPDFSGSPATTIGTTDTGDKVFHARWTADDTHSIGGTVGNGNGGVSGASVTIRGNGIGPKSTTTDTAGAYSFTGIPAGEYNIVASYNGVVQTIIVAVMEGDVSNANITIPTGRKNSILAVASDTPDVVVGYLDQQFTSADNSDVDAGNSVVIRLTVEAQNENTASGAEDIQTAASGQSIGMYLDLTLLKTRSDAASSSTDMLSTSETLLKIIIPYDLTGKTNIVVYRYHNGTAEAMTEAAYSSETPADECYMANSAGNQVIVWTKSFSTYAISYLNTYAVSYDGNGATGGSVPASGTIADGTDWSSPGNPGSLVRTGYTFSGWALAADATSAISTYTITSDTVFYAVWTYNGGSDASDGNTNYTITATVGIGGGISPGGSVSVTKGGSKTFTITADEGYHISDVLVDGVSAGAVGSYTFTNVTATHTISAVFAKASGLPYYSDGSGSKVFIGFAAEVDGEMKYIAPDGVTVLFTPNPKNFTDISTHWGKTYIGFVTEREIFVGTGGNLFSPDTGMTRAMFATVIGRLYERSYGEFSISDVRAFTDCDYNGYYGKYVDWAAENSIILGYGNGEFGPDDQITREQMAAILYRFADFLGVLSGDMDTALAYPDSAAISSWAENAALYCQSTGVIAGRDGGNFAPQGTATRAEVATILERFIENTLD